MRGTVREELWPPRVKEEGCDQATIQETDQDGMKTYRFLHHSTGNQAPAVGDGYVDLGPTGNS